MPDNMLRFTIPKHVNCDDLFDLAAEGMLLLLDEQTRATINGFVRFIRWMAGPTEAEACDLYRDMHRAHAALCRTPTRDAQALRRLEQEMDRLQSLYIVRPSRPEWIALCIELGLPLPPGIAPPAEAECLCNEIDHSDRPCLTCEAREWLANHPTPEKVS